MASHWLLIKTFFFMFLFLFPAQTFPRYRYDQIMRLGWKVFIPITIVWIGVVVAVMKVTAMPWVQLRHAEMKAITKHPQLRL